MNRYDAHLNKKVEKRTEDQISFKTKVYNRDIDVEIKRIAPKSGDILFIDASTSDDSYLQKVNDMIKDVVDEDVHLLCTNTSLNIQLVAPRKGQVLFVSIPGITLSELERFQKTLGDAVGVVDYEIVCSNEKIEVAVEGRSNEC